jgi:hypothetical protein
VVTIQRRTQRRSQAPKPQGRQAFFALFYIYSSGEAGTQKRNRNRKSVVQTATSLPLRSLREIFAPFAFKNQENTRTEFSSKGIGIRLNGIIGLKKISLRNVFFHCYPKRPTAIS